MDGVAMCRRRVQDHGLFLLTASVLMTAATARTSVSPVTLPTSDVTGG